MGTYELIVLYNITLQFPSEEFRYIVIHLSILSTGISTMHWSKKLF